MNKDNKKLSARQEVAKQRRAVLSSISRKARIIREARPELADLTINEILMRVLYNPAGNLEFKKFREWKEEGFTIKKGEKGFMLWAQPLEVLQQLNDGVKPEEVEESEENQFFPVCYLFSNKQVIKAEPKQRPQQRQSNTNKVPDLVF